MNPQPVQPPARPAGQLIPFPVRPDPKPEAWIGGPPSPAFWKALDSAQKIAAPMEKDAAMGEGKRTRKYSKTEDWIEQGKQILHSSGLLAQQVGGYLDDRQKGLIDRIQFALILPSDGTGLLYTLDWPMFGFEGGGPGDAAAAALTRSWKYWIRGVLMVPQVDAGEEGEYEPRSWTQAPAPRQAPAPPQGAPRQAPPQRQAPISQEPIVQRAQEILGAELPPGTQQSRTPAAAAPPPRANTQQPPAREPAADGGPDPTFEELVSVGWQEEFARYVAAVEPNAEVPPELREEFKNAVNEYFGEDHDAPMATWEGTGFTPQGRGGPLPTGVHLRRYCMRLDWRNRTVGR